MYYAAPPRVAAKNPGGAILLAFLLRRNRVC